MIGLHYSICPICNYKYKEWLEANGKIGWKYCQCKEEEE
mgnify:CR=1 FL=1